MSTVGDLVAPAHRSVGNGPEALLFLHGLGGDRSSWDRQLGAFGSRYRTIAWDMPGYGDSPPLPRMTFDDLAGAVWRLLDAIDAGTVHLVGHSMGGMIAQRCATMAPERLRSLTLVATTARFGGSPKWRDQFLAARLKPLDEGETPATLAPKLVESLVGEDSDRAGVDAAIASMSRISSQAYRDALACLVTFDAGPALKSMSLPTLVVACEQDRTAPAKAMQPLVDLIPDSRMVVLRGAGHLAYLEQPAAFNRTLADFLEEIG